MGTDKASLGWGAGTLLDHMTGLLRRTGADPVLTGGGTSGLADIVPGAGPVSSLCALANHVRGGGVPVNWVIVPIDMPLLTPDLLTLLMTRPGAAIGFRGQPLPLALRFDAHSMNICDALAERLATGQSVAIRALLDRLGVVELDIPAGQAACLQGANTPEEWAVLKQRQP